MYNNDTDGDGLSNFAEISIYGTDPDDWETDDDSASDGDEVNVYQTNPLVANDFILPEMAVTITSAQNDYGWNNKNVVVHFDCCSPHGRDLQQFVAVEP